MKLISIVTPCFNEEGNVRELYEQVKAEFAKLPQYRYEHIFIDNRSQDATPKILRELAAADPAVKVIFNARNFGHIRSPYYGLLQARGDAAMLMVADLQDPPRLIPEFLAKWEEGFKIVLGVKDSVDESALMFAIRSAYYDMLGRMSDVPLTKNNTGFGLYDKRVLEVLRGIDDPYPYFRGLVSEVGFESAKIVYHQPARKRGITSNNFYRLYDMAMLGFTNHSKVPLRFATFLGFATAALCLLVAFGYGVAKLLFWNQFVLGTAPLIIGIFFLGAVQLIFIGIIGEYVGAIHTQVLNRPLVVEEERLNFDKG